MSKKQVDKKYLRETHVDQIILETDDSDRYIFLDLPWYDKPLFSHRFTPTENKRTFVNRLPESVKVHMHETHGGYAVMRTDEQSYSHILF